MRRFFLSLLLMCVPTCAFANEDDAQLATKLSNPVSSLISVPFQFNYDCCIGPKDGDRVTLNIQPVIPFALNDDLTLIVRTITPLIAQEEPAPGVGSRFGLGDVTQSFFLAPTPAPGGIIWGAGPVFLWPTGTDETLSSHKWGAGPTVVVLKQDAGWTYGVLANHIWSYGGERDHPNISSTFVQPFVGYTWPDTTGITMNSESTYDWEAKQWTMPISLTVSHIYKFGKQPVSFQLGARYYADRPSDAATWGLRFAAVFLFPG